MNCFKNITDLTALKAFTSSSRILLHLKSESIRG